MSEIGMEPQELLEQTEHNRHLSHNHESHSESPEERFTMRAAITASILAVGAALTSLLAGQASTEAIIKTVESSDKWTYYQAKSTKEQIIESDKVLLAASSMPQADSLALSKKFKSEMARFEGEKMQANKQAKELENESRTQFDRHEKFSWAVAAFQIGIVLASISILVKNRFLYMQSVVTACAGVCLAIMGLLV